MDIAWGATVGHGTANPRALPVMLESDDSAAGAHFTTVHCVSTSQVGAGHGPGVLQHRRGHLLLIDNSISAHCQVSTVRSWSGTN